MLLFRVAQAAVPEQPRKFHVWIFVCLAESFGAPDVIAGSGLQEISPERAPFGALTVIQDLADARRLKESGAWFVADGTVIAQICAE